jgi:L-rhamnose mutarotase
MKRYCLTLDLKNDPKLIAEYKQIHKAIWPDIARKIKEQGITVMDIYLHGNRLFMIMETTDSFSFYAKSVADNADPKVQEWENLMWQYQQALPNAKPGEKWVLMEKIFGLP